MKHIHRIIRKKDCDPTRCLNFLLNLNRLIFINAYISFEKTEG